MIELDVGNLLAEAEGGRDFQLHFRPVVRVTAPALGLPVHGHGKGIVPHQLLHILPDAVGIAEFLGLELAAHLVAEPEGDALVDHRLTAQHIPEVFHGNVNLRKNLFVRLPVEKGAGLFPVRGGLFQAADVPALLKMEVIPEAIPADGSVEILRGVLGGAGAQTVEAQRILIVLAVFAVLAAGVHLTEHQLPVIALLPLVIIHGTATAEILHLHAEVLVAGDDDGIAIALSGLINGVGENLKHRVLAALQIIRPKDNRRALAHPLFVLQGRNTVIPVYFLLFLSHNSFTCHT